MDGKPESWQTNAAGPCITIGDMSLSVLGDRRYRVQAPSGDEQVDGFEEALQRVRELVGLD